MGIIVLSEAKEAEEAREVREKSDLLRTERTWRDSQRRL
jgi:hypothetical protein